MCIWLFTETLGLSLLNLIAGMATYGESSPSTWIGFWDEFLVFTANPRPYHCRAGAAKSPFERLLNFGDKTQLLNSDRSRNIFEVWWVYKGGQVEQQRPLSPRGPWPRLGHRPSATALSRRAAGHCIRFEFRYRESKRRRRDGESRSHGAHKRRSIWPYFIRTSFHPFWASGNWSPSTTGVHQATKAGPKGPTELPYVLTHLRACSRDS
jgi:hypothetical protein